MTPIRARQPNAYAASPLDRAANRRDDAGFIAATLASPESLFVPLWRGQNLLRAGRAALLAGRAADPCRGAEVMAFLGLWEGRAVFAVEFGDPDPDAAPPALAAGAEFADLRTAVGSLPAAEAAILAHARALMHWRTRHRFCPICGGACAPASAGHVLVCTRCQAQHFPRTDPAVIMLVARGDQALLGHAPRFPAEMYSTLAGFVEPGESLEEAVAREVFEETGVRVGAVHYHSSQPWPFPASIMLGFHAEALTEEIVLDHDELADARWFSRADLRDHKMLGFRLPRGDSIARRLIEDWLVSG